MLKQLKTSANQQDHWLKRYYNKIWLPYTQMKTSPYPLPVKRTYGSKIELDNGNTLIDGIASWWTACHGYNHPKLIEAISTQMKIMPHIMFGGLVHEQAFKLANILSEKLGPGLDRVFFTESGSTSVEVAMKIAVQFWQNQGINQKMKFVTFHNSYHGDTLWTMSVCDPISGMHKKFNHFLPKNYSVPIPVTKQDIDIFDMFLEEQQENIAGILIEPLVQGAGGMIFHEKNVLKAIKALCEKYKLILIFDEIFVGFGRTGTMFAFEQSQIKPDIITLSKALTGGTLPLAATVVSSAIFEKFYTDDDNDVLMHGPTFMANPLGCAAAIASIDIFYEELTLNQVKFISKRLTDGLMICKNYSWVMDVRILGAIGVVEFNKNIDCRLFSGKCLEYGIWARPIRNVAYLTPALNISEEDLEQLIKGFVLAVSSYQIRS